MYWNFKIAVRLVILLLGGHFIAKKMFAWSILLQNGTSVFPGSFYIDVIGHVILDQRILRNLKEF